MTIAVLVALLFAVIFLPGVWVQRVLERYATPANRYPVTGAEAARKLLDAHRLASVGVEETRDGDHYDPESKMVRLAAERFHGRSLTAITVAAHEVGHAVQDAGGYRPLRYRTRLVRATRLFEKLGAAVLVVSPFVGALTRVPGLSLATFAAGLLTLGTSTLVHCMTLPTEFDASFGRALPMLDRHRVLHPGDEKHARRILLAAALTYVAASLTSLLNIARWIAILRR